MCGFCRKNHGGLLADYYLVKGYSKEYPKLIIEASVDQEGRLSDNYVSKRICDRMSEKITENLTDSSLLRVMQRYTETHEKLYSEFDDLTENALVYKTTFENSRIEISTDDLIQTDS